MADHEDKPKTVVVKIGGSFLLASGEPNVNVLKEIVGTVKEMVKQGYRVVAVVGGGIVARQYIKVAQELGANNGLFSNYFFVIILLFSFFSCLFFFFLFFYDNSFIFFLILFFQRC